MRQWRHNLMSLPPAQLPGQTVFDEGLALVNKGYPDQGEPLLAEAARLGHPYAARAIVETRLANKVVGLAKAGQRSLALACLEEARWQPSPPSDQLVAWLRQHLEQFQDGQFVKPADKVGWYNMGVTLMDAGKHQESTHFFRKAIDLDRDFENAWLNLGLALGNLKEYQDALLVFDCLLANKPESFHGWHLKGMTLGSLKKQDEAVACYDRALKLKPDLAETWFNKSLALGHLQKHDESVSCCDRVLELNPRHLKALLQKGRALHRLGRQAEAIVCCQQMNRIDPIATSVLLKTDAARNTQPWQ